MRAVNCLLFAATILAGCSGSGTNATGGERVRNTVRASLGTSTANHIIRVADEALMTRYGYRFERRVETAEDIRLESSWKELSATDDEKAVGIGFARVRITIRARPRGRGAGTYVASFHAEVEGRSPVAGVWKEIAVTEGREDYLKELITYFENEFKGVR